MATGSRGETLMLQPAGQCKSLPRITRSTAHIGGIAAHIEPSACPHPAESSIVLAQKKETK